MAAAYELYDSRSVRFDPANPGSAMKFIVTGAATSDAALAAVQPTAVYRFAGFTRLPFQADARGGGVWAITVPYGIPQPGAEPALFPGETLSTADAATDPSVPSMTDPFAGMPDGTNPFGNYPDGGSDGGPQSPSSDTDPLGPEWGFDTTGGTKSIRVALLDESRGGRKSRYFGKRTILSNTGGVGVGRVDDYGGLIGVKPGDRGRLEVDGKEVVDPKLDLTTTRTVRGVSLRYIRLVAEMTGSVNKTAWGGAKAGELLFLGASGQYKPGANGQAGSWSITYRFAWAPNRSAPALDNSWPPDDARRLGLPIAGELFIPPGETLDGWDLLDVTICEQLVAASGREEPVPQQFAIHRVFPRTDFRFLGFRHFNF